MAVSSDFSWMMPSLRELHAHADRLVARIEAHRRRYPGPVRAPQRGRWWRVLNFPITTRKFERVLYCQGEPWIGRWREALRLAAATLVKTRSET